MLPKPDDSSYSSSLIARLGLGPPALEACSQPYLEVGCLGVRSEASFALVLLVEVKSVALRRRFTPA